MRIEPEEVHHPVHVSGRAKENIYVVYNHIDPSSLSPALVKTRNF